VDAFANEILDAGAELQSDHPGFNVRPALPAPPAPSNHALAHRQDAEYRRRRAKLADSALKYSL
jgi:hypothetical protein